MAIPVRGSSGSVLTIFQEQLERGGPLTVTDPSVRRFFMTVEEAAGLILLSGLEPDKDVEIRFTGLRAIDSSAVVRRLRELVPTFRPAAAHEAPAANPSSAA